MARKDMAVDCWPAMRKSGPIVLGDRRRGLGDPNASKTTKTPVPSASMVHSACCFSVMGQPSRPADKERGFCA
jgi:hypothetical protein